MKGSAVINRISPPKSYNMKHCCLHIAKGHLSRTVQYMGYVKLKNAFEHVQNEQIQTIILVLPLMIHYNRLSVTFASCDR